MMKTKEYNSILSLSPPLYICPCLHLSFSSLPPPISLYIHPSLHLSPSLLKLSLSPHISLFIYPSLHLTPFISRTLFVFPPLAVSLALSPSL